MSGHKPRGRVPSPRHIVLRISGFVLDYLVALPLGCLIGLTWANIEPESYYRFAHPATFYVNDIGFAFFIALITKEITEATLPGGPLHPWQRAALSVAAAVGGALFSVAGYLWFLDYVDEPILREGWVASCAVDIAASYVVARLIFGRHAAVPFMLLVAMAVNGIGLLFVATMRTVSEVQPTLGLALIGVAVGGAAVLRRRDVQNFWWYLLGPGVLSWLGMYFGGVQPALALVPIVPFMPHGLRDPGLLVESPPEAHDTLTMFERWWRLPVEGVLLFFGIVNAGVPLFGLEPGTWAIPVAAVARPFGVVIATGLALAAGLHLPKHVGWKELIVVAVTTSTGLVFALFFATVVMPPGPVLQEMKMGALLTVGGVVLAFVTAFVLRVGRFAR